MKDEIYRQPGKKTEKFTFSSEVSHVFDDMITRSVPGYLENLHISADLIYRTYHDNEWIVDLGSSTGALAEALVKRFGERPFKYLGIDNSGPMVEKAEKRLAGTTGPHQIQFKAGDIRDALPEKISVAVSSYTLQFIDPKERVALMKRVYHSLLDDGAFLFSEKVIEENDFLTSLLQEVHHDFKRKNGYSDLEISRKRDAIENVLVPISDNQNRQMALDAGFQGVCIYLKMINFTSFMAVKK